VKIRWFVLAALVISVLALAAVVITGIDAVEQLP
jgi:hypothetical protein